MSRFIQQIFAITSRSRQKTERMQSFWPPIFFGRMTPTFLRQTVSAIYRPPFDLRLQSLAMKWNAEFTEGWVKITSNLKPLVDQSSRRLETM